MVLVSSTAVVPIPLRGGKQNYVLGASILNNDYILVSTDPSLLVLPTPADPDPVTGFAPFSPGSFVFLPEFDGTLYAISLSGTQTLLVIPAKNVDPRTYFGLNWPFQFQGSVEVGTANTQLQFVMNLYNLSRLCIIIQISGTVGAGKTYTVEVSPDGITWFTVDTPAVGALINATDHLQYDENHLATTVAVDPADWPYVRFTVPALGGGNSATVYWGAKQ